MNPAREIHLHIERLILDGLPIERSQGAHFTAALEAELTQVFARPGMEAQTGAVLAKVAARSVHLSQPGSCAATSAEIAGAVHQAVTQTFSPPGVIHSPDGPTGGASRKT